MATKRAIPPVPKSSAGTDRQPFDVALKENVETLMGLRGEKIAPLKSSICRVSRSSVSRDDLISTAAMWFVWTNARSTRHPPTLNSSSTRAPGQRARPHGIRAARISNSSGERFARDAPSTGGVAPSARVSVCAVNI